MTRTPGNQVQEQQAGVWHLSRGHWPLRAPGPHRWVARGWGPNRGPLWAQARVWMVASCPEKGADPHQGPLVGTGKDTRGAQAGKTGGLAKTALEPGTSPQTPGLRAPSRGKTALSGGPKKGQRAPGAGRGLQTERRLVGGEAQASWMAKLRVWEGAEQAAQGNQVSPERGLLLGERTAPPESPGVQDDRGPGTAWMVPTAEKSLAMGRGVGGLVLRWAQDTGEEGAPWMLGMTAPVAQRPWQSTRRWMRPAGRRGGWARTGAGPRPGPGSIPEQRRAGLPMRPETWGGRLAERARGTPGSPPATWAAAEPAETAGQTSTAGGGTPPRVPGPDASLAPVASLRTPEVGASQLPWLWGGSGVPLYTGVQGRSQACLWAEDFAAGPEPHFQGPLLQSGGYSASLRGWDAGFSGLRGLPRSVLTPCVQGTGLVRSPRRPLR